MTLLLVTVKALSQGTRQSRVSSSFLMGDMHKRQNAGGFAGGAEAERKQCLVHPKSCCFHEQGASWQEPPKIKIFYLFVRGSCVGFNQSENWLLTTTCNISLSSCRSVENMMKIAVNPTGISGVVWSIKISEIIKKIQQIQSVSVRSLLMKTLVDAPIKW